MLALDDAALQRLGVASAQHRRKLLVHLRRLLDPGSPSKPPPTPLKARPSPWPAGITSMEPGPGPCWSTLALRLRHFAARTGSARLAAHSHD